MHPVIRYPLAAALAVFFAPVLFAQPSPAEQEAAVAALTSSAVRSTVLKDTAGNVTHLAITNHANLWRGEGPAPAPLDPAIFRENILKLPFLEAIGLEQQLLGDEEYALLGNLQRLRDVRLHYMYFRRRGNLATADAPLFINQLPASLQVLELKHNFHIEGGCMDRLNPQPALVKLEIDTGYATPAAVPFILAAPGIRNLQIHRTSMSSADFARVVQGLPSLEILEVRPQANRDDPITGRSLEALRAHPSLQILRASLNWRVLDWDNGLSALASIPTLRHIVINPSDIDAYKEQGTSHPSIQRLHQARPDIRIQVGNSSIGGDGASAPKVDEEFNWDNGVTTHC